MPGAVLQAMATACRDLKLLARLRQVCKPAREAISDPAFMEEQSRQMALTYPWVDYARERNLLIQPTLEAIYKWVSFQHYYTNDEGEDGTTGDELQDLDGTESDFDDWSDSEASEELSVIYARTGASTQLPDRQFFLSAKAMLKCAEEEKSLAKACMNRVQQKHFPVDIDVLQMCSAASGDLVLQCRFGLTCRKALEVVSKPQYVLEQVQKLAAVHPWIKFARNRGLLDRLSLASVYKWLAVQNNMALKSESEESDSSC